MACTTLFLVVFFAEILVMNSQKNCGYYWKMYDGTTPNDAVEGGKHSSGEVFYIGLVHLKLVNEILPGMIQPKKKTALVTSYGIVLDVKNDVNTEVKILCSENKEGFEWIPTTSANLHLLTNRSLVPGGVVLGQHLYIGRVLHDGGVVLGKVFPHTFVFQGLWIPSHGTHFQYLSFEVLTYNCQKKSDDRKKNSSDIDKAIEDIFSGL